MSPSSRLLFPFFLAATWVAVACGGSTGSSTTSDSGSDAAACPTNQSASQTVTFRFQPGTTTKYVAVAGQHCSAFSLTQGTKDFLTTPPFECGCECAGPQTHVVQLMKPNDTFAWPALTLATCTQPLACGNLGPVTGRSFPTQRVVPGAYRMTFVTYDTLPAGCADSGDNIGCGGAGGGNVSTQLAACPGDRVATVDFSIPASGDVTVDVPLP